jgi:hypothetical protein
MPRRRTGPRAAVALTAALAAALAATPLAGVARHALHAQPAIPCPEASAADSAAARGRPLVETDPARARRELEDAVRRCPDVAAHHLWLGHALINQARDAGFLSRARLAMRAKAVWETALRLDTASVEARWALGVWHLRAPRIAGGSAERAMALAEEIRLRDPARGALAAAHVHAHRQRTADAVREARRALALDPGNAAAAALLARLGESP